MRILIVAATAMEIAPVMADLGHAGGQGPRVDGYAHGAHHVDVLITGIGMVATAAWCARILALTRYDLALNFGVCGSFDPALAPGCVVHVVSDRIAEIGAEDGDAFLTMEQLGLPTDGECINPAPPENVVLGSLPAVRGITVNTVHGNALSIADTMRRFAPQIETMEGAAFMYACTISGIAFAQVRAVSNMVERRDRGAWKMSEAIDALGRTALGVLSNV